MDGASSGYMNGVTAAAMGEQREFWTNACIMCLLDEYEKLHVRVGRGHLKVRDWESIAEEVNRSSGSKRTPEQCKSKIEGLKKYYRRERLKANTAESSRWIFYDKLSRIVGDSMPSFEPALATPANAPILAEPVSVGGGGMMMNNGSSNGSLLHGSDVEMKSRMDFRKRMFERMGIDASIDESFNDFAKESPRDIKTPPDCEQHQQQAYNHHYNPPAPIPLPTSRTPIPIKNSPSETTQLPPLNGCQTRKKRGGGGGGGSEYSKSVGKDIKEGLSNFASVMEKIEKAKMDFTLSLQRQRMEQDRRRAEMEVERTKIIINNQLELAKLLCAHSDRDKTYEPKKQRWMNNSDKEEEEVEVEEFVKEDDERIDNVVYQTSHQGEAGPHDVGGFIGQKGAQIHRNCQVIGDIDGSHSYGPDGSAAHIGSVSQGGSHDVSNWTSGMGMMWRHGSHDLNSTLNNGAMINVGVQGDGRIETEDEERIVP